MTLHDYLELTTSTPRSTLRRAMAAALAVEAARTPAASARFYDRVIDALCRDTRPFALQTSPLWDPTSPCRRVADRVAVRA